MSIASLVLRAPASLRYRAGQALGILYRASFAQFGDGSVILKPQMLMGCENVQIGRDVLMRDGAWIAAEGENGRISIGDSCYFGHRFHIHSIDPVSLGSGIVVADNVMITSTDHGRVNRHEVHGTGPVVIGDNVFIGQNAVILGGVTIGDGATIAAGAVVVGDVAAGTTVGGVPAKSLRAKNND